MSVKHTYWIQSKLIDPLRSQINETRGSPIVTNMNAMQAIIGVKVVKVGTCGDKRRAALEAWLRGRPSCPYPSLSLSPKQSPMKLCMITFHG